VLGDRDKIRHAKTRRPLPCEIEVELVLEDRLRKILQAQQRIFHGFAEKPPAQQAVVQRNSEVVHKR